MPTTSPWTTGLLQIIATDSGFEEPLVGTATISRDPIGQATATFELWMPEGYGHDGYDWARIFHLRSNLLDERVELVVAVDGQLSVEGSAPIPDDEYHPLRDTQSTEDEEMFEALCELIGNDWQVQPVDDEVLAARVDGPDGKRLAKDVQNLPRWQPASDSVSR